jgi:UDP-glucose 4-epimerase
MGAYKQMTQLILLTGGLGYVGGRVAEWLSKDPDLEIFVTSRDPSSAEVPEWLPKDHCIKLNILNDDDVKNACKDFDIIVHFVALNEIDSIKDPGRALLINGLGTQKIVKAAETAGVTRFIYLSTAHIYRSPLEGTISETTLPRPIHPYAISHRTAEDFVLAASQQGKFQGIVLRLSNSIGVPINSKVDRWSLIGNDLCRQAITTKQMQLKTAGNQERDFITLYDVARAVSHMIQLPDDRIGDGIFNLGGENSLSINQVATKIQERCNTMFHFTPPIVYPVASSKEICVPLKYSIEKLKSTGFIPTGSLEMEIDNTLSFCQKHYPS